MRPDGSPGRPARACAAHQAQALGAAAMPPRGALAQLEGQRASHGIHRGHRLVEAHEVAHARKRDLRAHERRGRGGGVALLAGHLHEAAHRVAHQPHERGERVRGRIERLRRRAARHLHGGRGGHGGGCADLRLAAAFGARHRGVAGYEVPYGTGGQQPSAQRGGVQAALLLQGQQHAGQ